LYGACKEMEGPKTENKAEEVIGAAAADAVDKGEKGVYSREAVKTHSSQSDCWVVLHGNVYDVTKYLDEHPGGPEIIADVAGMDATSEFEDTGHSEDARETLKKFLIGKVEGGAESKADDGKAGATKTSSEGPSMFMVIAVLIALLAGAYMMYESDV